MCRQQPWRSVDEVKSSERAKAFSSRTKYHHNFKHFNVGMKEGFWPEDTSSPEVKTACRFFFSLQHDRNATSINHFLLHLLCLLPCSSSLFSCNAPQRGDSRLPRLHHGRDRPLDGDQGQPLERVSFLDHLLNCKMKTQRRSYGLLSAAWSENWPPKHCTTWRLGRLIIWRRQVSNVTLPVPQAAEKFRIADGRSPAPVAKICGSASALSATAAADHGHRHRPARPPRRHHGLRWGRACTVQRGPPDWQVRIDVFYIPHSTDAKYKM